MRRECLLDAVVEEHGLQEYFRIDAPRLEALGRVGEVVEGGARTWWASDGDQPGSKVPTLVTDGSEV